MNVDSYSPEPGSDVAIGDGEAHVHSFRLRGWRWTLGVRDPEVLRGRIHLTTRRFVVGISRPEGDQVVSVPWSDVIEFESIEGTRALETLLGAEGHMLHAVTKQPLLVEPDQVFLFEVEPTSGAQSAQRPEHCARFIDITDDLMVDAFGEG
jgi:hypothetical protein